MRSEEVYFDVPLASSLYERPSAGATGSTWLVTGLAFWSCALLVGLRRARRADAEGGADPTEAASVVERVADGADGDGTGRAVSGGGRDPA